MTDNEINTAIAEACGWKPRIGCKGWYRENHEGFVYELPNYCHDLNAMHEAEEMLYGINTKHYCDRLRQICGNTDYSITHATARQRAEAFLRTIWKWRDE